MIKALKFSLVKMMVPWTRRCLDLLLGIVAYLQQKDTLKQTYSGTLWY